MFAPLRRAFAPCWGMFAPLLRAFAPLRGAVCPLLPRLRRGIIAGPFPVTRTRRLSDDSLGHEPAVRAKSHWPLPGLKP
eukprot:1736953-Rhodomonas_salina.1